MRIVMPHVYKQKGARGCEGKETFLEKLAACFVIALLVSGLCFFLAAALDKEAAQSTTSTTTMAG